DTGGTQGLKPVSIVGLDGMAKSHAPSHFRAEGKRTAGMGFLAHRALANRFLAVPYNPANHPFIRSKPSATSAWLTAYANRKCSEVPKASPGTVTTCAS